MIATAIGADNASGTSLRGQQAGDSLLGISQPVGLYQDSVNEPHPFGSNNAFFDVTRVEVVAGPQGTLYGRNTTGGAINIITRDPDYNGYHGFAQFEAGNFSDLKGGFAVNVPIIDDKLAIRLAYQHWSQDGFGKSIVTGERFGNDHDDDLVRLSVKFDPTTNFTGMCKVEYDQNNHTGLMVAPIFIAPSSTLLYSEAVTVNPTKYEGPGTLGCTHLNDALRALAEVPALIARLQEARLLA